MNELQAKLLERTLQACSTDYTEQRTTFADLDTKAQNTAAMAGIFLATAFAFLDAEKLRELVRVGGFYVLGALVTSLVLLLGSTVFCLFAMRIRRVFGLMESVVLGQMVKDIETLSPEELTAETAQNVVWDQIRAWQRVLSGMSAANQNKAWNLLIGQWLLAIAIVFVGLLTILIVTAFWSSPSA